MKKRFVLTGFLIFLISCKSEVKEPSELKDEKTSNYSQKNEIAKINQNLTEKQRRISEAAISIIDPTIDYDPTYFNIPYPNGDVPAGKGVCTDIVIRTFRKLGVDLQKEVHEDMKAHFNLYPKIWGLSKPDTNIDHRRVPNLMVYFSRFGEEKSITQNAEDYLPGDIVCWKLNNDLTHIGIVVDKKSDDGKRYQIVHNIGRGQVMEDILFDFDIIGHYAYESAIE